MCGDSFHYQAGGAVCGPEALEEVHDCSSDPVACLLKLVSTSSGLTCVMHAVWD
jgi:hypothetical protein